MNAPADQIEAARVSELPSKTSLSIVETGRWQNGVPMSMHMSGTVEVAPLSLLLVRELCDIKDVHPYKLNTLRASQGFVWLDGWPVLFKSRFCHQSQEEWPQRS